MTQSLDQDLRQKFLAGMSHAAATVNVITTDGPAGRSGVTVSAMASVSADTPRPTLLVCVHHLSPAAQKILDNGVFCVNVLRDDQGYISDTFAGRFKHQVKDKFSCADWTPMASGAPRVIDPLVGFDCTVTSSDLIGTHYVFFGEVSDLYVSKKGSPLLYANRAYGAAQRIDSAESIGAGQTAQSRILSIGCFHTFGPYVLPEIIRRMSETRDNLALNLVEGDQRRIQESLLAGDTEVGLLYDLDLSDELDAVNLTQLHPYVLLAEGHPLAEKTALTPQDLEDHPMILINSPPSQNYFPGILEKAGVTPNIAYKSTSFEMVRGMVGHGLGFALLTTKPASTISYDGKPLVTRPLQAETEPTRVVLATRKGRQLSRAAEHFIWYCRDFFAVGT